MTNQQKPEALRLAEHLERFRSFPDDLLAAAELRLMHSEKTELLARVDELIHQRDAAQEVAAMNAKSGASWAARVQELESQLEAIGAGGVEPLRSRCLHQIAEPEAQPPAGWVPYAEFYCGDGRFAICDWEDYKLVRGYSWRLTTKSGDCTVYAQAWDSHETSTRTRITMHGTIIGPLLNGMVIDHINGDGLDNRRSNLRVVTHQQNSFNQKPRQGSSKYKGVSLDRATGMWRAGIRVNGVKRSLGRFVVESDAAKAYDSAASDAFGEHARTNFNLPSKVM